MHLSFRLNRNTPGILSELIMYVLFSRVTVSSSELRKKTRFQRDLKFTGQMNHTVTRIPLEYESTKAKKFITFVFSMVLQYFRLQLQYQLQMRLCKHFVLLRNRSKGISKLFRNFVLTKELCNWQNLISKVHKKKVSENQVSIKQSIHVLSWKERKEQINI